MTLTPEMLKELREGATRSKEDFERWELAVPQWTNGRLRASTVLALLDRIEALEKRVAGQRGMMGAASEEYEALEKKARAAGVIDA